MPSFEAVIKYNGTQKMCKVNYSEEGKHDAWRHFSRLLSDTMEDVTIEVLRL